MLPSYAKLIEYKRNGLIEQEHNGLILHFNKDGIMCKVGATNNYKLYQRSCMKPLQLAKLIDLGIDKKYSFNFPEIAVMAASHTGEPVHQEAVRNILSKLGLSESNLLCPAQTPLNEEERERLVKENESPKAIHNNCSGKHCAMLALCLENNLPIDDYMDDLHPLAGMVIDKVVELCNISNMDYVESKDGCGLPTIATKLEDLATGYYNLFFNEKYEAVTKAFLLNPYMIGGQGRLDSEIMAVSNELIAKVGAGGIVVIVNLIKEEILIIKIADSNMQARSLVTIETLRQLGWLSDEQIASPNLRKLFDKEIKTLGGKKLGSVEFNFQLK